MGDRWAVGQTVEIYGLAVPIEEAALVADPHAPPGALSLQLVVPCVSSDGVEVRYLELMAEGAARTVWETARTATPVAMGRNGWSVP